MTLKTISAPNTPPSKYSLFTSPIFCQSPSRTMAKTASETRKPSPWTMAFVCHRPSLSLAWALKTLCKQMNTPASSENRMPCMLFTPSYAAIYS